MALAIKAVWPLLLNIVYFFFCRHYPWVTMIIVEWMRKHIPELLKCLYTSAQEDVNGAYDVNLQQQAVPPNRNENVPTTDGTDPAASTSGPQPAPAALFSIQESAVQHSRTFDAATQEMLGGRSSPGAERPRGMTEQKTKNGTLSAISPASGGSSSAPLSRSG